jgi:hypothetical protein
LLSTFYLPLKDYFSILIYFEAFSPMIDWDLANLLLSYEKELKYLRENASHPLNLSKKKNMTLYSTHQLILLPKRKRVILILYRLKKIIWEIALRFNWIVYIETIRLDLEAIEMMIERIQIQNLNYIG